MDHGRFGIDAIQYMDGLSSMAEGWFWTSEMKTMAQEALGLAKKELSNLP